MLKVSQLSFELIPEPLSVDKFQDPDLENLDETFRRCFFMVFEQWPKQKFPEHSASAVKELCDAGQCDATLAFLSIMFGHLITRPDSPFFVNMLVGDNANHKVQQYREACVHEFGCFDATSLKLRGDGRVITTTDEKMLISEMAFGSFLVGREVFKKDLKTADFYSRKLVGLQPHWLATEPSFVKILKEHTASADMSSPLENRRHIHRVAMAKSMMLKNKALAAEVFKTRERNMPKAVKQVLKSFSQSTDFELDEPTPVKKPGVFWKHLGTALYASRTV